MEKKEIATQEDLIAVLDLFDELNITYWLDGGWGVDVLYGKQTRNHRDIDINYDASYTEQVLGLLKKKGYEMVVDQYPVRMELYHKDRSYIDIHPFILNEDGTTKQADLEGSFYEFEADIFATANFNGRSVPCISLKGQKLFHTGYELREVDKHDIKIINQLERNRQKRQ